MKPCPFCGKEVDLTDPDVLYPSGIYWTERNGYKYYHGRDELTDNSHKVMTLECPEGSGGCGISMMADSKEEVFEKWNRRVW